MGLYFCRWAKRVSLLIDAEGPGEALKVARDAADGAAPSSVAVFPRNVFVAEVFDEADEDDEDAARIVVEPLAHVLDVLGALEDAPDPAKGATTPAPVADLVPRGPQWCHAEAEDDAGAVVTCEGSHGHQGQHRSGGLVWS